MRPKPTALERVISTISPEWALKRMRARMTVEMLARHYEAAQPGRRTAGWSRNATDVDLTIAPALLELRMHARDLMRNNSWARRARSIIANNTVGWGINPKATGSNPTVNAQADLLWKDWAATTECESEGRHTFYGIQHLAMKHIVTDGEVLIRRRARRAKDNLTLPLQLQVLEADFLDQARSTYNSPAGGPTINGVEYDKLGRRAAYWLYEVHPGSGRNVNPSRRIPADQVLHIAYTERALQTRGVSWLGAAIVNLKDLDEYDDAELMKQKIAACFAAFVSDTELGGTLVGEPSTSDPLTEVLQPGMIEQLPPGKQVTFGNPPLMTSDALPTRTLRRVASGLGVTYEDLSGDYSQVNFSSARMSRLSHWSNVYDWQWNMLIPLLCQAVWDWAMESAVIIGELPEAPGADWTTTPMPMIEPDKEGLALQRMVRGGAMTFSEMIRGQGGDPEAHFKEYADDLKRLDDLKITLDSDARKVSQVGQEQPSEITANEPAPKPAPALPPGKALPPPKKAQ